MLRESGLDYFEQADVWRRISERRPGNATILEDFRKRNSTRISGLLNTRTSEIFAGSTGGIDQVAHSWGHSLSQTARGIIELSAEGQLAIGPRTVLCNLVLFHWNRLGLSFYLQAALSFSAAAQLLDQ